MKAPEII